MINIKNTENIVIIGNGISGISAADAVRKNNKEVPITVVSHEIYSTYYRLRLCELIASESDNHGSLIIYPEKWYEENNIKVYLSKKVVNILPKEKTVLLETGVNMFYSKLIVAAGSSSCLPDIPGRDKNGVFTLRTLKDINNLRGYIAGVSEAIIVGGGLLGLEAAYQLNRKGIKVSIVEAFPNLMSRQFDREGSLLLEEKVRSLGIDLFTATSVKAVNGADSVEEVVLSSGEILKTKLVLFSIGVRPNADIVKDSGIGTNRGLIVDSRMRTNEPDIYACGDIAEFEGTIPGLWIVAMNQGKVAGINASGGNAEYKKEVSPYFLNTMGIKAYSIGDVGKMGRDYDSLEFSSHDNFEYRRLYFVEGVCVGGILIGNVENFNKINNAIKNRLTREEITI